MGAFDLIRRGVKGIKNAPFFSKVDEVLDSLPRNKGTGDEFLREIEKTKGVKPAEIQDRGIAKALKGKPKMTKAEVKKILESSPPPRVKEEVRGGNELLKALDQKAQEIVGDEYATFDDLYGRDRDKARSMVESDFGYDPETQYESFKTPGGKNYREILLKLPKRGLNDAEQRNLMLYEADVRRGKELDPWHQKQYAALKEKEAAGIQDYSAPHFEGTPNILAHIRVQDYEAPNKGFAVINRRSGLKSEVFPTMEQAEAAMAQYPESLRGMLMIGEAQGRPKRVLLVDEIQSDWHQAGRELRSKEIKRIMEQTGVDKKTATAQVPEDFGYAKPETSRMPGNVVDAGDGTWKVEWPDGTFSGGYNQESAMQKAIEGKSNAKPGVPDAPFKKNWHELAMKRVLDYAAENGYDSVAITPGVQQVKRYEDATRQAVDEVAMYGNTLVGFKSGRKVIEQPISSPDELEQYIGKDMAQKLSSAPPDMNFIRSIKGEDLTVGGEGMKGFYDEKLVNYLNNFGKPYGSSVGQMDLPLGYTEESGRMINDAYARGSLADIELAKQQAQMQTLPVHRFDITPQLRDEVKNKGLPMYGKVTMPVLEGLAAGTGAATIGSEVFDTNNEQQVQNPVHFTENPDAMLLELMQRN
jgi:hypothetical protein